MASFFDDPETKVDDYWAAQNEAQKGVQVTEVSPPVAASGQPVQPTPASNPNIIANRTPAVTQNKQSYQIMEDIYSLPKPEYDATKASEIKRLAKINALSQGFNVLGDVVSLGMGANVNKRQPDTLPQQLWQYKQHYDDTYQQRLDQWRTQQAIQRIRGLERQEQLDYQRQRDEEARKFRQQQFDADKQYKQWLIDEKLADNKAAKDRWDKEYNYRVEQDKIDNRLKQQEIYTRQGTTTKQPEAYMNIMVNGKEVPIGEGAARLIYNEAVSYYNSPEYIESQKKDKKSSFYISPGTPKDDDIKATVSRFLYDTGTKTESGKQELKTEPEQVIPSDVIKPSTVVPQKVSPQESNVNPKNITDKYNKYKVDIQKDRPDIIAEKIADDYFKNPVTERKRFDFIIQKIGEIEKDKQELDTISRMQRMGFSEESAMSEGLNKWQKNKRQN